MSDLLKIKEAQEAFQTEWKGFKDENDIRLKKIEDAGGNEAGELKAKFEKFDAALDAREDAIEQLTKDFTEEKARVEKLETAIKRSGRGGDPKVESPEEIEHKAKFDAYLRKGDELGLKELELKVLNTGTNTDGGYAVGTEREAAILTRVTETSPFRGVADVRSISAPEWEQMRVTGVASGGGWVSEQGTRGDTATPTFGMLKIAVGEHFEQPAVTQTMLDDQTFDIEGFLGDETAIAMAIRENTAYVNGDGVGKPRGYMTYTAGTSDVLMQVEQVNLGHASTVAAKTGSDGLIDVQDALLEEFQAGASWVMARAIKSHIRKLADADGNYLLRTDFAGPTGFITSLLGKPINLMSDMTTTVGANNLIAAYGDFRQAYKIVDRVGIRVLRDALTSKPYIKFYTTKRTGGGIVKPQAIKIAKVAA